MENVAVAKFLGTSTWNVLLWLRFWAFHRFRKPFELTIVRPNHFPEVCKLSRAPGARAPERVRERYCYKVLSLQYAVIS